MVFNFQITVIKNDGSLLCVERGELDLSMNSAKLGALIEATLKHLKGRVISIQDTFVKSEISSNQNHINQVNTLSSRSFRFLCTAAAPL
jgi:hypothetical protein